MTISEIKRKGKTEETFFFEYFPEISLIDLPDAKIENPIKVSGEVYLTGPHSAVVSGEVCFTVTGQCTRCLEQAVNDYTAEFEEECTLDSEAYKVVLDKIDLKKIVNDTVITNSPMNFLCKDDCKGICTGCGVNLNLAVCKCKI